MLRSMRNGFFSAIFLALLVLGGFSLVLTDWNGMFRNGGLSKTDIAVVDGTPIKIAEFNTMASRILRNQNINTQTAYESGLLNNILQNEIITRLLQKSAKDMGIEVEDKYVAQQIKNLIAPLVPAAGSEKAALQQFLTMQGLNEKSLAAIIRHEIAINILKSSIGSASYVPDALNNNISSYKEMTKDITYTVLDNKDIKLGHIANDEELETYYEGLKTQYMIPEKRDAEIAIFNLEKEMENATVTDDEIQAYYNENKDTYARPETRMLEQSITKSESDAKKIITAIQKGAPMKDAVKSTMGDEKAYAGENSFAENDLTPEIAKAVFAAKQDETINPVQSPLGYHVITIKKITPAHVPPIDELKDDIRQTLADEKSGNHLFEITSEIEDRLAAGDDFKSLQKDYAIEVIPLEDLSANSVDKIKTTEMKDEQKQAAIQKIFLSPLNESSTLSDLGANTLYSVRTTRITESSPEDFSKIKDKIKTRWISEQQARENLIKAQKLADDLNDGKTMSGNEFKTVTLSRTKDDNKNIPDTLKDPRVQGRFLDSPLNKFVISISTNADRIIVGKSSNVTIPDKTKGQSDAQKDILESDLGESNLMLWVNALQNKYPVEINEGLLQRAYGNTQTQE